MLPGHRDRHDPLLNLRAVGDTGRVSGDRHVTLGGSARPRRYPAWLRSSSDIPYALDGLSGRAGGGQPGPPS